MGDAVTVGIVFWLTDSVDAVPLAAEGHVFILRVRPRNAFGATSSACR